VGNILKFVITLVPLMVFVMWTMAPEKFKQGLNFIDTIQGQGGWVQLNPKDAETVGQKTYKFLEGLSPNPSANTRVYYQGISSDVDRIAYFIQNYWVWCTAALLFLICIVIILRAKDYK